MDKKIEAQLVDSPVVRLYPPGIISVLTILTAFPAGYVLMIINWRRMGKKDRERTYIFGLLFSSLVAVLLAPFYARAVCDISIINIAIGIYFYNEMTQALYDFGQRGNKYVTEKYFTGCLIGLLATVAWIIIAAILISAINLFTALLFFNNQR